MTLIEDLKLQRDLLVKQMLESENNVCATTFIRCYSWLFNQVLL